jgi:hypothetical protein
VRLASRPNAARKPVSGVNGKFGVSTGSTAIMVAKTETLQFLNIHTAFRDRSKCSVAVN